MVDSAPETTYNAELMARVALNSVAAAMRACLEARGEAPVAGAAGYLPSAVLKERVTEFIRSRMGTALFDCCESVVAWMLCPGNEPPSPVLFLYSRMDRIIRASSVQAYIARLREAAATSGTARSIDEHQFPLGQHVACFWMSAAKYCASVEALVRSRMENVSQ